MIELIGRDVVSVLRCTDCWSQWEVKGTVRAEDFRTCRFCQHEVGFVTRKADQSYPSGIEGS